MKPRFRARWEVLSEELCVLASWFLSPMSKNSVLEELRVRRLAVYFYRPVSVGRTAFSVQVKMRNFQQVRF